MGNVFGFDMCMNASANRCFDLSAILSNVNTVSSDAPKVVLGDITMYCYSASVAGVNDSKKPNQDRLLLHVDTVTNSLIVGVFDGHGKDGHTIAEVTRDLFLEKLLGCEHFVDDPLSSMHLAINLAENDMISKESEASQKSGTTVAVCIVRGHKLYAMNIGDSRMFYSFKAGDNKIMTENISQIHCPDHISEKSRIEKQGGHVMSFRGNDQQQSIPRVFADKSNDIGGLAMSRSVGDIILHRYGVISEPDLYERDLDDNRVALLIGSDGLTTCFGMATCFKEILSESCPLDGLHNLMGKIYEQMYEDSQKKYVDDISGIYIQLCSMDDNILSNFEMKTPVPNGDKAKD